MSSKTNTPENVQDAPQENTRREFIRKYGKLAAITPVAVTALMSPSTSAAPKSCKNNGRWRC